MFITCMYLRFYACIPMASTGQTNAPSIIDFQVNSDILCEQITNNDFKTMRRAAYQINFCNLKWRKATNKEDSFVSSIFLV